MPKTIEYPRTNYLGAWEVAEVVDDTGGKCSIDACARKLNRKVSGSFKAILGSAVKFGLLTSKREMLTTTNLFRRIKNAYDKEEEKIYHREAFLHPPLFSHICRKFRNRELPVHMLDVMLVREFNVEEINAQSVAKAFVEGARMVDIIDERNIIADIDQLAKASPRRELASPGMSVNMFKPDATADAIIENLTAEPGGKVSPVAPPPVTTPNFSDDAVASLFGFGGTPPAGISTPASFVPKQTENRLAHNISTEQLSSGALDYVPAQPASQPPAPAVVPPVTSATPIAKEPALVYTVRISGPGVDTQLAVLEETDLLIVQALLEKVRKHLQRGE